MINGCRAQDGDQRPEEDKIDLAVVVLLIAVVGIVVYRLVNEAATGLCEG